MKQEQAQEPTLNKLFVPWMRRLTIGLFGFILFLSLSGVVSFAQDTPQFPLSNPQQGQPTEPQKTVPSEW